MAKRTAADLRTRWANRIVGEGEVDPKELAANPKNWRIHPDHQREGMENVLDEVGWVQRVMVNKRSGFVVDGHMRVGLALAADEPKVPVSFVDLTEEEEALVMATLDPLSALASSDAAKVEEVLEAIGDRADGPLTEILQSLQAEADAADQIRQAFQPSSGPGIGLSADAAQTVKVVLYVDQVATFEEALQMTGMLNRGEALMAICRVYLTRVRER